MTRRQLFRVLKLGSIGCVTGGAAYLLYKNDWEISTVGAVRFGRAAFVAAKVVVDYKWTLRNVEYDTPDYERLKSEVHTRSAIRLREMCCKNGGAFIKVGQHVGTLEYLLPQEYVSTMKVLHNQAPQSRLEDLERVFEEDIGKKIEDVFTSFDPEPIGTASLAQVHKATTKDGRVMAVKIQHPRVKAHSRVDIKTMTLLIHQIVRIFPDFQYTWLAEETERNLPLELDFLNEGKNCEQVSRQMSHFKFLKVPKIYWDLSSDRVLTMEYCDGGKVDDIKYMTKHKISVSEVTRDLGKLYSEMIFVQGYVHCDPHPGNVLVNKTEEGTQIVLLDHGLYQTLTNDFRMNYAKLWLSLIKADLEGIKQYSQALNAGKLYPLFACMLTARSWDSINAGIGKKEFTREENDELKENAATYFIQISQILNRIPRQLLLIMKTNDVLRGIEASLKTRANASSFLNMSRCCIRAVAIEETRHCKNVFSSFVIKLGCHWQLLKLNFYELYLWFASSSLGQLFAGARVPKAETQAS